MANTARLIEGGSRPIARARFGAPRAERKEWPWHTPKMATFSSRLLWGGDRRMEAGTYLSSGHGIRLAIESRATGWERFETAATITQPGRFKGILVDSKFGVPFLSATQAFDCRPISRKWLALEKTSAATSLRVAHGTILITRSGSVGRCLVAHNTLTNHLVSDDLIRVIAVDPATRGWLYAYLRSPLIRQIMVGAHYGHVIKHLEISHIAALPLPRIGAKWREHFNSAVDEILLMRNAAYERTLEAERILEEALTPLKNSDTGESGFSVLASKSIFSGRRRLEALPHNPAGTSAVRHLAKHSVSMITIKEARFKVWVPGRYKRIPAEAGISYVDSSDLFEVNPDLQKRFADCGFGDRHGGRVQPGWLLVACSGQIYGVNGSCSISGEWLNGKAVSNHVIRVAPTPDAVCRIGYLATVLGHPTFGRPRVKSLAFGSSIPEIETEDFVNLQIPLLEKSVENRIADLAEAAAELRSQADILENRIADEADMLIDSFVAGKDLDQLPVPAEQEGFAAAPNLGYGSPQPTEVPMIGIEKTPGVNGGDACIASTRIPVWVIEEMRRQGWSEPEMLADFPGLSSVQLKKALAYAKKHPAEIAAALRAHAEA